MEENAFARVYILKIFREGMPLDPPRGNVPVTCSIRPPAEINYLLANKFDLLKKLASSLGVGGSIVNNFLLASFLLTRNFL